VNVVVEPPLYRALGRLAKREGISLSMKARDLLRDAVEASEDLALSRIAAERDRTFDRARTLSHAQVWGRRRPKRG
jgi:nitrate reductase assembly molybdenum cofactor insertion protein NarJ